MVHIYTTKDNPEPNPAQNTRKMLSVKWAFSILLTIGIACGPSFSLNPIIQQQLDRVLELPGQNFNVSFAHYAGYVTVNKESGRALFYWFFEAEEDPSSKPLLLWLNVIEFQLDQKLELLAGKHTLPLLLLLDRSRLVQHNGGPGCSSIAFGLAEEIGPFHIEKDGKTLYFNPYSWTKVANILFLDSPVGAGFSYSNTSSDILSNGDKRTASDNLKFLLKWFERFPQYKGRDFYMAGESYAGHYVPQLSQAIVKHKQKNGEEIINLKGFMVGNALTDDYHDNLGRYQFWWSIGLISHHTYEQLNILCDIHSWIHVPEQCRQIIHIADQEIGGIDIYSIYSPPCTANFSRLNHLRNRINYGKVGLLRRAYDPCTTKYSVVYFNLPEVQDALHVHKINSTWETCSDTVHAYWLDSSSSVLDIYRELLPLGLRIWLFSGDMDGDIPVASTRYSIDALKLPTVGPHRPWYDDGEVGGWSQEFQGLTFVTVRGAGHEVALHKPKLALTLLESFLSG